ncbi:hypothetical protein SCG7086_CA_00070 [Chlamydiales bacterium SCGC AG-110-P3]|nr:hypothetical protein SCG7086_CA_00070 [Chlamydiales bacterium SCGC AG-110-P3]
MHKNRIWMLLLVLILLAVAWFGAHTAISVYQYSVYTGSAVSETMDWSVIKIGDDKYHIQGHYRYTVDGTTYQGTSPLAETTYRNQWAARDRVQTLDSQGPWRVWHIIGDPSRSTLQKSFPLKECVSMALLCGLLLYFAGLGYYVASKTEQLGRPGERNDKENHPKV